MELAYYMLCTINTFSSRLMVYAKNKPWVRMIGNKDINTVHLSSRELPVGGRL